MYQAIPGWLSLFRIIIITPQWCDGTNLGRIRSRCPQQQDDYCTHGDQPVLEGVVVVYAHFTGYNRGSNNMITTTTIQPCSTTKSYHFFDLLWDRPPYRLYYRKWQVVPSIHWGIVLSFCELLHWKLECCAWWRHVIYFTSVVCTTLQDGLFYVCTSMRYVVPDEGDGGQVRWNIQR